MRAPGEGSIRRRRDGRWSGSLQFGGTRRYIYGQSKQEVARQLHDLQKLALAGRHIRTSQLTLAEFFSEWRESVRTTVRPTTWDSYSALISKHVLPTLGPIKLSSLRPVHIVGLYNHLERSGSSPALIRYVHHVLRRFLGDAEKWELVAGNPASPVAPPKPVRRPQLIWSLDETQAFLQLVQKYERKWDPCWIVALGTGLRLGELLALTWADVDLDEGALRVSKSIIEIRGRRSEGAPKTEAGKRTLHIPAFAVDALRHQRRRVVGPRIFLSKHGTTPTRSSLRTRFRATCRAAGVPEIRIHDLRHVHATLAIRSGADPKTIQRRLGHSTLAMTLGLYAHALTEGDREAAAGVEKLLGRSTRTAL